VRGARRSRTPSGPVSRMWREGLGGRLRLSAECHEDSAGVNTRARHNACMGPESRPRDDVLAQTAGDTLVLLTPDTGEYFTLNEVGGRIWQLSDGTRTVAEIAGLVGEEYEAPVDEIQADALEVLAALAEERLVRDGEAA
jgi:hypothetical protein